MSLINSNRLLHTVLWADGASSGAMGLALAAGAGLFASLLQLPEDLLRVAGLVLLPYAAGVLAVASRAEPGRRAVMAIAAVNVLWVLGSAVLLMLPGIEPGILGTVFVIAQAGLVALFAELQLVSLKRLSRRAAAA